jgi:hypothetical protein
MENTRSEAGDRNGHRDSAAWFTPRREPVQPVQSDWVTLAVAARTVNVSVSALRKAYRDGRIESRVVAGRHGPQREVRLAEVANVVGRRRVTPLPMVGRDPVGQPAPPPEPNPAEVVVPAAVWHALVSEVSEIRRALGEMRNRLVTQQTDRVGGPEPTPVVEGASDGSRAAAPIYRASDSEPDDHQGRTVEVPIVSSTTASSAGITPDVRQPSADEAAAVHNRRVDQGAEPAAELAEDAEADVQTEVDVEPAEPTSNQPASGRRADPLRPITERTDPQGRSIRAFEVPAAPPKPPAAPVPTLLDDLLGGLTASDDGGHPGPAFVTPGDNAQGAEQSGAEQNAPHRRVRARWPARLGRWHQESKTDR